MKCTDTKYHGIKRNVNQGKWWSIDTLHQGKQAQKWVQVDALDLSL